MTSSTLTPAEPTQKTAVTSQLIAAGGGCTACTMLSSTAELAFMTGMDAATTTTASPSRNASDARRLVMPPPRGPGFAVTAWVLLSPFTGPAGNDPGRGSARPGQPSFTAVPEALTISMLLPTVS